jgi:hypothetical protein
MQHVLVDEGTTAFRHSLAGRFLFYPFLLPSPSFFAIKANGMNALLEGPSRTARPL